MYTFENRIYYQRKKHYSMSMKSYSFKNQPPASYRTLPGIITHDLREAILSGQLAGGVQLKQEELAARFGVSMSALREALKSLEAEGLVTFYPNRGAVVSELSAEEAKEIFDIRIFLELGALELAVPNLTETDLAAAGAILDRADGEADSQLWTTLNWQFHETIYRVADRPKLFSLIQNLHNNVARYMRIYLSTLHYQEKSQAEHRALLKACQQKDVKAAQKLLRKHMAAARDNLSKYLGNSERTG